MPSTHTILLVEDNVDNLLIYTTILEFRGYAVVTAKDGISGLARVREDHPSLILMDVSLPGMDGWEVTRTLKADPATAGVPIVVLTAHALASDRERAYEVGANGYVAKPADPVAVADAVTRMLADPEFAVGFEDKPVRTSGPAVPAA